MKTTATTLFKGLLILVLLCMSNASKAQYYFSDFGPGSAYWCAQMAQREQAQRMEMFVQQMQLQQYLFDQRMAAEQQMNTIMQSMPSVNSYNSYYQSNENVTTYHQENVPCDYCNGGVVIRQYMNNGQVRTQKRTCGYCHGKGYTRKTVQD